MLEFISTNIDLIINVSGGIMICLVIVCGIAVTIKKGNIEEAVDRKVTNSYRNKKTQEIYDKEEGAAVTPDTIRKYEKDFNKSRSLYNVCSQLVPIFPLLGILGTVAALMLHLKSGNLDAVTSNLHLALSSTFEGIIWTIGLKFLITIWPARIIDDADIILDDYDKKVNNSYMQKNIEEDS